MAVSPSSYSGYKAPHQPSLSETRDQSDFFRARLIAQFHDMTHVLNTTGERQNDADVNLVSWWPRADIWDKSSLNIGYWTPYCESFFVRRLKTIRDGTFELRTQSHWKRSLKHAIVAQKVQQQLEKVNQEFLAKEFGVIAA